MERPVERPDAQQAVDVVDPGYDPPLDRDDQVVFAEVRFFGSAPALDLGDLDGLIADVQQRSFSRGDVIFTEGDEPTELFVVVSGRIAMANRSIDGRESVVALMERGDLFGEMPLFDGLRRSAEARVLEPSDVVAIPYAPLRQLYESRPELLWNVVALLATLVLLFGFQGEQIIAQPMIIALLAVPILIQVYFNAGLAYLLNRATGEAHCVAGPSALIGASNFFELAVAAAISLFGFHSGAALATVVGVLIEVPVMLSVVRIVNASKGWYEQGPAVAHRPVIAESGERTWRS